MTKKVPQIHIWTVVNLGLSTRDKALKLFSKILILTLTLQVMIK